MKLAIVTNNKYHHKYFIVSLYNNFDVELIVLPSGKKRKGTIRKILNKQFFNYGVFWFCLKAISLIYNKIYKKA